MRLTLTRRTFFAGAAASLLRPRLALAAPPARCITLFARGGWDPTCALDPKVGAAGVAGPEREAGGTQEAVAWFAGMPIAVHPYKRPAVERFFAAHGQRALILNGISTGTVDHAQARRQILGEVEGPTPAGLPLPRELGSGALPLDGAALDPLARGPSLDAPRERGAGMATFGDEVDSLIDSLDWRPRRLLDTGLDWDTHRDPARQHANLQILFARLHRLVDALRARGELERTLVVVLSELGRAPVRNVHGGKDHWPVTSALLVGGGIRGGRVLGGTDEALRPLPVCARTGEVVARGQTLTMRWVLDGIEAHLRGGDAGALRLA